jgi:hypothetical protein
MSAQRPRLKGTPRKKTDTTQSRCCHRSKMSHVALIDVSSRFTRSHKGGGNWDTSEERANDIVNFKCHCAAMKMSCFCLIRQRNLKSISKDFDAQKDSQQPAKVPVLVTQYCSPE